MVTFGTGIYGPAPASTNRDWVRQGAASLSGSDLVLTAAGGGVVAGASFYSIPVPSEGLSVTFTTAISGGSGGAGMCLALADPAQTTSLALGGTGSALGFTGIPGIAVAINTDGVNQVSVVSSTSAQTGAPTVIASTTSIPALRTGTHVFNATIHADVLTVTVDGSIALVTPVAVSGTVLVGFTASNGIHDDNHIVRAVSIAGTVATPRDLGAVPVSALGTPGGVATLDASGTVAQNSKGAWIFDVTAPAYGAVGDGQVVTDGAITSGQNVLTCATSTPFTAKDVGKAVMVKGAGAAGVTTLVTTIAGYTSPSQVTLTANAGATVASGGMVLWATDDTAAIQAAINAAFAYGQAHGTGTVLFPPGAGEFYGVAGALVAGGATKANGQLTIPLQPVTSAKVVLRFLGVGDGGAARHWQQTVPQVQGSTLVSFGVFASVGAQTAALNANGQAACISGPTGANGYGTNAALFNNVMPVFEKLNIFTAHAANGIGYGALNLHGCANAGLYDFGYGTIGTNAAGDFNTPVTFANGAVVGVVMPASGNNDSSPMRNVWCHGGYTRGIFLTEHCNWQGGTVLYCWSGICPVGDYGDGGTGTGAFHGVKFEASVEGCTHIMEIIGPGAGGVGPQIVGVIDNEGTPTIYDASFPVSGGLASAVGILRIQGGGGTVSTNLGTGLVVINDVQAPGLVASPPVLTINTAIQNPYARYAEVTLQGGLVTSVQLGLLMGGASAPTMQTVFSQSSAALPLYKVRVPPLGWIQVNGTTTPAVNTWFLE